MKDVLILGCDHFSYTAKFDCTYTGEREFRSDGEEWRLSEGDPLVLANHFGREFKTLDELFQMVTAHIINVGAEHCDDIEAAMEAAEDERLDMVIENLKETLGKIKSETRH